MALRIGGFQKPPVEEEQLPVEEPMPEDLLSELPESLEEEPVAEGGGDVPPEQVHYKSGEQRLNEACENCKYFVPENACSIVAGEIDPAGICNIYVPMEQEEELPNTHPAEPMPEGEPYPEEGVSEAVDVTQEGY